jgi:hypothetical protein
VDTSKNIKNIEKNKETNKQTNKQIDRENKDKKKIEIRYTQR